MFDLRLDRRQELEFVGNPELLLLQRAVHQTYRWRRPGLLRLDASHLIRPALLGSLLPQWTLGPCDHRGMGVALQHLLTRLIDAWICPSSEDLPAETSQFTIVRLWSWPVRLAVHACHPLASERRHSLAQLSAYPSLEIPSSRYPRLSHQLASRGLGRGTQLRRFDRGDWVRVADDVQTIVYANSLVLSRNPELVPLSLSLDLAWSDTLVVLSEWVDHPQFIALLDSLQTVQDALLSRYPDFIAHL